MKKTRLDKNKIPYVILFFGGLLIFMMGILNHYFFRTYTYDYGNYNFAFWDYSHFRISPIPTFRGNFLQDHFSFALMYFVPVYWILNWLTQTYTLIIIQNSMIMVAAWYSYKLIRLKTENIWLCSGVLLYYFTLLGRFTTFASDVNLAVISACFIPIFLYYFETKKYIISSVILILALFSRENIPVWFVFIFIVLIIQHRKDKQAVLYSLSGILVSVLYFVLLFKVFIPSIETPGVKFTLFNYSALGATPKDALIFILNHPIDSIRMFFVNHTADPANIGIKAEFYWVFLISGGFVLFFRPQYILWFIPIVAQKVLNDASVRWGIATYYSIEIVTLLPLSVFLILSSFKSDVLQKVMTVVVCVSTVSMTIYKMDQRHHKMQWAFVPEKTKFFDKRFYKAPFDVRKVNELLNEIPDQAKVSASSNILPHIAQRQFIYFFPTVKDADYIVFSMLDNNYLMSVEENDKNRNLYLNNPEWEIIGKEYPVFLLKKKMETDSINQVTFNANEQTDTLKCNFEITDKVKKHVLFSNLTKADTISHLSHDYFRSENSSLCLTSKDLYSHGISLSDIKNTGQVEVSVWYLGPGNSASIVIDNRKNLYFRNDFIETVDKNGWKKITLKCSLMEDQKLPSTIIYLWNTGSSPVYFDDLQIIKQNY